MTGTMADVEINKIVEDFGQEESKVRVLVATDVASEGINLHYLSHRLIHFDIPWSLMVFQQRNGRIDRYGQEREPEIYYMQILSRDPEFKGDNRILEVLIQKDQQATENIGDPSAFMNVYDPQKEEEITANAIMSGKDADEFSDELDNNLKESEFDFLALLQECQEKSAESDEDLFVTLSTLFKDDHDYAVRALKYMQNSNTLQLDVRYEEDRIELHAPEDLKYRFKMLPREVWPKDGYFILSSDLEIINKEIKDSRKSESAWPQIHYLWEQHPVLEWIRDKLLSNFNRLEAPLIRLSTLDENEVIFIISGVFPNKKAQPVINHWVGVCFKDCNYIETLPIEKILERTELGKRRFANKAESFDTTHYESLLPKAIEEAKAYLFKEYETFESQINEKLQHQYDELERLKKRHMEQYGLFHEDELENVKEGRRIKKIFDDYFEWLEETMCLEKEPYIQVIAGLCGESL